MGTAADSHFAFHDSGHCHTTEHLSNARPSAQRCFPIRFDALPGQAMVHVSRWGTQPQPALVPELARPPRHAWLQNLVTTHRPHLKVPSLITMPHRSVLTGSQLLLLVLRDPTRGGVQNDLALELSSPRGGKGQPKNHPQLQGLTRVALTHVPF